MSLQNIPNHFHCIRLTDSSLLSQQSGSRKTGTSSKCRNKIRTQNAGLRHNLAYLCKLISTNSRPRSYSFTYNIDFLIQKVESAEHMRLYSAHILIILTYLMKMKSRFAKSHFGLIANVLLIYSRALYDASFKYHGHLPIVIILPKMSTSCLLGL